MDYGGNNLGYWRVGIAASDTPTFDRNDLKNAGGGAVRASASNRSVSDIDDMKALEAIFIISADDNMTLEDCIRQKVAGAEQPVPVEVEVYYEGEFIITGAGIRAYTVNPDAGSKDVYALTDDDIGILFVNADMNLFPNESNYAHFMVNPAYIQEGAVFALNIDGEEYPLTRVIVAGSKSSTPSDGSSSDIANVGSSGGGCDVFSGSMAGFAAALFLFIKGRKR